ncbi:GNAT family N-acetyltransferase [Chelativorans sp. YIM 93263]|uniref:GNAT family N-acetyltransferase n=1 Tax=Chelativorans sp. YIM 93263 TaxID=2906648 RepID=UPI0023796938|nr:GNAT family N-acetyltransferase [Chelativorans sp. YIM 93263]
MRIELLQQADSLEEAWWDLWRRDPCATPFQSPAWLLPWRRHYDDGESVVLAFWHGERLVGLLPFYRLDGRLLLWGAGPSDRLDGLFDPALDRKAVQWAVNGLGEPLDLFQLPADSPLRQASAPDGWQERSGYSENCAVLPLPARPSAKMNQNVRYYRRRAIRAGVSEPEQAGAEMVGQLAELHTRRWNDRGESGVFADERFRSWQQSAAISLERVGILRLFVSRMAGRPIAALFVMAAKRKAYYYIGGFDPEYAKLGLGTVLVSHAIEDCERAGLESFDFLRGHESYKYRWGAVDESTFARKLAPSMQRVA